MARKCDVCGAPLKVADPEDGGYEYCPRCYDEESFDEDEYREEAADAAHQDEA